MYDVDGVFDAARAPNFKGVSCVTGVARRRVRSERSLHSMLCSLGLIFKYLSSIIIYLFTFYTGLQISLIIQFYIQD